VVPLLAACVLGYVIGAWHVTALRNAGSSTAADTIALRFPHEWSAAPAALTLAAATGSGTSTRSSASTSAELFSPIPMTLPSQSQAAAEPSAMASADPHLAQTTSLANIDAPIALAGEPAAAARSAARPAAKAATAPARTAAVGRPSYILDDAQIASIKQRLHLTADQERMWLAVEAALRNMAYKRTQQAAGRAAARNVQTAAVDPEAVEGLKSAAVPLIMSFSSEQKDEVRSLVHVMGLDQLAAQF
jgi:hypothetical protein